MATITQSTIVEDAPQKDGRRWITERHIDNSGAARLVTYLAPAAADATTTMTGRVATVVAEIEELEIQENMARALGDGPIDVRLIYTTAAQNRARLRQIYQTAKGWQVVRLGWYINSLGLTDPQLSALFGVSGAQLTALKTKLAALATKYNDVIDDIGD